MSLTIYKYEFKVDDEVMVRMPLGAKVLSVGIQQPRRICLWAIVDSFDVHQGAMPVDRRFKVRGTGQPLGEVGRFVGTVIDGLFVWHVFEG